MILVEDRLCEGELRRCNFRRERDELFGLIAEFYLEENLSITESNAMNRVRCESNVKNQNDGQCDRSELLNFSHELARRKRR